MVAWLSWALAFSQVMASLLLSLKNTLFTRRSLVILVALRSTRLTQRF